MNKCQVKGGIRSGNRVSATNVSQHDTDLGNLNGHEQRSTLTLTIVKTIIVITITETDTWRTSELLSLFCKLFLLIYAA